MKKAHPIELIQSMLPRSQRQDSFRMLQLQHQDIPPALPNRLRLLFPHRPSRILQGMFLRIIRIQCSFHLRNTFQSRILPSLEIVTTCHDRNLPLFWRAVSAALCRPPQHGTSMRTIVTLFISLFLIISVSFSV